MTQWYVKDLSKLTNVTVQTLHHYDRIDLLKPSIRLPNGYRVYSEKDLLKLQQIIALKFFGFELSQIKVLLANEVGTLAHFSAQAQFLEQKSKTLLDASQTLKRITAEVKDDKSIPWETIIELIEVYRMTQQLEHSWVKEIFTPEELKQYSAFEAELKNRSTPEQKADFEKKWSQLIKDITNNSEQDPSSEIGIKLGGKLMELINGLYGKKYAHLRTKKFEKGYCEGKGLEEIGLTPALIAWIEQAVDSYYRQRIYNILAQFGKISLTQFVKNWNEMLDEMHGEDTNRKKAAIKTIYEASLKDERISSDTIKWLKDLSES